MKYLKIKNSGELDVRLISLMGGTTKTGNEYKIGRFGSGLKYSLSYLVRNNIDFKIFVGEQEVKITTQQEHIQGTTFDIIYINGQRSSITSTMGLDWEGWMIVREIYCNALDEGSHEREITDTLVGENGCTTFYLQLVDDIKKTVDNWNDYFLHDIKPIYETKDFALYPPSEHFCIYKNGVLIEKKDTGVKGVFSYDIKNAHINELREYKGWLTADISAIIKQFDKKCADIFLSNVTEKHVEWDLDYNYSHNEFNNAWKETIGNGKIIAKEDLQSLVERGVKMDSDTLVVVPKQLFNALSHRFDGISAVRKADKVNAFYEIFDAELELKIKSALAILDTCGYEVCPELKLIYGVFGDQTVFAKVNIDAKEVMFSVELKRKSMFEVVTTIIEEQEHFITGFGDCTRTFQQHFIDLYAKRLLEKNEVRL